jgi:hypothetical protein
MTDLLAAEPFRKWCESCARETDHELRFYEDHMESQCLDCEHRNDYAGRGVQEGQDEKGN